MQPRKRSSMQIETNVELLPYNTLALAGLTPILIRVRSEADLMAIASNPEYVGISKLVLGGGSNIVLSSPKLPMILKVEIGGRRLVLETEHEWIVEAGAGENWHDFVTWTLDQGWPGLENLALIPGTAGAAPIQNIGAYGVELKDRFLSLDAVDLKEGRRISMTAEQCRFGYRDSIFKHEPAGRWVVTRVRLRLPKPWTPVLDYPDLRRCMHASGAPVVEARQIYAWVCDLRRSKLPDPAVFGNAGSFFKNPVVDSGQLAAILSTDPQAAHHLLPDGTVKLSAGWMIDTCGWKGKRMGNAGVYAKQALVLCNHGGASAHELMTLAAAIQDSVRLRFGIQLELEPTLV
jgi:UDP-N-acetylmuramate dehydrogenase